MKTNRSIKGKSIRKVMGFLLASFMLMSVLSACSSTDDPGTAAETTTAVTTTVTEATEPPSKVPEGLDFDGAKFTLLGGDAVFEYYTMATDLNGDTLNDALYNRYEKVGGMLNLEFDFLLENASNSTTKLTNAVLAGDDEYQLAILQRATKIAAMVGSGVLYNWNDMPYIDLTGEEWYQDAIDSLRVGDLIYYTYGDIYPLSCHIFYYNKTIREAYELEEPTTKVLDGTWTIDDMIEMSSAVSADLDGDGAMTVNDQYGMSFASTDTINSLMYGMGIMLTEKTDEGVLLSECDEKRLSAFEKVHELFWTGDSCYKQTGQVKLINGNTLFYNGSVHGARTYRDSEVEFGVLPYPKYNEEQEHYISFLNTELMCIPSTADPEMAGAAIQLLAEESGDVKVAYYEYLLQEKVARDPESAQVLDLIFDNAVNDFLISFCNNTNCYALYRITSTLAMSGSTDYVSQYERYKEGAQAELDAAFTTIIESEYAKNAG